VHVNYSIRGWVGASNNDPAKGLHTLNSGPDTAYTLRRGHGTSSCTTSHEPSAAAAAARPVNDRLLWTIGNESVPIQQAQWCWFPGPAISNAEIWIYFQIKYAILSNSTHIRNCCFEITKMLMAVLEINLVCYFLLQFRHTFVRC